MTTAKPTRPRAVTHADLDAIRRELTDLAGRTDRAAQKADNAAERADNAASVSRETHDVLVELRDKLMKPFPGQETSLLDRTATMVIAMESGGRVAAFILKIAALILAVGTLVTAWRLGLGGDRP